MFPYHSKVYETFRQYYTVKKKSVKFTVKNWQLWLPEFYRKKYGNNILGFTVLTYIYS